MQQEFLARGAATGGLTRQRTPWISATSGFEPSLAELGSRLIVLSESDLLSALATDKEKSPARKVADAPDLAEPQAIPDNPSASDENATELPQDISEQTSFVAEFEPEGEVSKQPAAAGLPEVAAEPMSAEQPASISPEPKNSNALSDELFTAQEFESALAEVDAAALKSEAGLDPESSTAVADDGSPKTQEPANPAFPTDSAPSAVESQPQDPVNPAAVEHAVKASRDESVPDAGVESNNPGIGDQSQKDPPPAAPAKGLKFAIGKKAPAGVASSVDKSADAPPDPATASPAGQDPPPETATVPASPRAQLLKRLIRAVEAGLDAIHKPIYARMPGVLRLIGIWSLCTIVVSLAFIFGLPVLMSHNDAISHLEQCLLALSGGAPAVNAEEGEKEQAESHGADKGKKSPSSDKKSEKHGDVKKGGHATESSHAEKKPSQEQKHGGEDAKKKDASGHGTPKPDAGHGAAPKAKPKEKPKPKKAQKPKDAPGTGH